MNTLRKVFASAMLLAAMATAATAPVPSPAITGASFSCQFYHCSGNDFLGVITGANLNEASAIEVTFPNGTTQYFAASARGVSMWQVSTYFPFTVADDVFPWKAPQTWKITPVSLKGVAGTPFYVLVSGL